MATIQRAANADLRGGRTPVDDALRESEAKYRTIFNAASDAIFLHDPATGAILDVNHRMTEMFGFTQEEAICLSVEDLSAGEDPYTQARALEFLRAAASGTPQLFEWLSKDRTGRLFWVEVNIQHVVLGGADRLLAIVRDISDRKAAEREIRQSHESQKALNALLRLALDDMPLETLVQRALGLVLQGPWPMSGGRGAVFLTAETGALGLEAQIGLDRRSLERETAEAGIDCVTGPGCYCVPITAGDATLGVLKLYLTPGHALDPSEEEFLGAFTSTLASIIMRKRAERSLRAAEERLREQAALVRLGEMAAVVAHEVKNPLAGVRGAIQIIGGRLPADTKEAAILREVVARLDALDELMQDLLLFARPPQAHPVPVDITMLANEVADLMAQDPTARGVRFEVEGSAPAVMADPKLFRIVLLNLVLNAAHAMQGRGTVKMSLTVSGRTCRIVIADTGPGIPADIRDRIFVPFFTTKARGTGLGLSTAKRLVEAHEGRISVECPAGGGTVVTIEWPAASVDQGHDLLAPV
jgi:two-component system, cell cycle sensor histidine kinase and response regulator CckA